MLEIYNSYLTIEKLSQESSITRFGEIILYYLKSEILKFEIHKNNHNISILKGPYVNKILSDQLFGCLMGFFKNARKVVTPIRKAIISLYLSLDKTF